MSASDLIVIGIGPTADILHLVLTGLNILSSPSQVPEIGQLVPGVSQDLFTAFASGSGLYSKTAILLARSQQISWAITYASVIASAQLFLQFSLDGLNWYTVDTSTNVNGEIRQVYTSARFVRALFGPSTTAGILTTVTVVVKPVTSVPTSF